MSQRKVVFIDGVRTAFGRMGGALKDIYASKLASIGIDGLLEKTKIMEKTMVESVFLGSATGCSHSFNPARHALLGSKLGYETSASYVEMQCGSAIDSINHAAWKILAGQADVIIAGGMESYSQIPVKFPATRKTPAHEFDTDEHPRPDSILEKMALLPPVFKKDGTVTAGNSSGQNDGAAFVLMMSAEKAGELGYKPMAKWLSGADCGCDPKIMGIGPAKPLTGKNGILWAGPLPLVIPTGLPEPGSVCLPCGN